jgi:hypothetical protein
MRYPGHWHREPGIPRRPDIASGHAGITGEVDADKHRCASTVHAATPPVGLGPVLGSHRVADSAAPAPLDPPRSPPTG